MAIFTDWMTGGGLSGDPDTNVFQTGLSGDASTNIIPEPLPEEGAYQRWQSDLNLFKVDRWLDEDTTQNTNTRPRWIVLGIVGIVVLTLGAWIFDSFADIAG